MWWNGMVICHSWHSMTLLGGLFLRLPHSSSPTLVTLLGHTQESWWQENTFPFFPEGVLPAASLVSMFAFLPNWCGKRFNWYNGSVEQLWSPGVISCLSLPPTPHPKLAPSLLHSRSVVGKVEYQLQPVFEEFLTETNVRETVSQVREVREG